MSSRKEKFFPAPSLPRTNGLTPQSTQQLPLQQPSESQSHLHQQQQPRPVHQWSEHRLNLLPPTFLSKNSPPSGPSPSPFPRYGHALSAIATAAGELFLFGGFAHNSLRNDLYVFSTRDHSATLLQTSGEIPSPRVRQTGAHIGDALLIWGGATNTDDQGRVIGPYDDSLYLLNLASREWTRVVANGPSPQGRYCHAVTMVGSKFFIFGGETNGKILNDIWAFDLNSVNSNPVWESYEPAPGGERPPPRGDHVLVTIGNRIILFGGSDGQHYYNDTWLFDVSTRKWTKLQCTGKPPPFRHGHAAALVDDVMYVFGGRGVDKGILGDLLAFKLSTQRWFMFKTLGPSPGRRYRHAMASDVARIFVLGGKSSATAQGDETGLIHVLDTKHMQYLRPDLNAFKPSEKSTQLAQKSLSGLPIQEQPQHLMSSSSVAYAGHGASSSQKTTPGELDHPAFPQIIRERNPSPNGLPSQPTGVNGKLRRVPEENDDGEGLGEYRVRFAGLDASSEGEVARLGRERFEVVGDAAAQTERDRRLAQLTDELALKSTLLEQAEANAAEATKRAGLEHAQVVQKDAELADMQAKLDESRDQHVRVLEQAQSALQKATSRAAGADERSRRACEQIAKYEAELTEVRAKLEAKQSELEAVRSRLTIAETGWAKSKSEADTLRALTTVGLVSTAEDPITRGLVERMRAMEAEVASLRMSEKSLEEMQSRNEG